MRCEMGLASEGEGTRGDGCNEKRTRVDEEEDRMIEGF
jgi:hypothetical protein